MRIAMCLIGLLAAGCLSSYEGESPSATEQQPDPGSELPSQQDAEKSVTHLRLLETNETVAQQPSRQTESGPSKEETEKFLLSKAGHTEQFIEDVYVHRELSFKDGKMMVLEYYITTKNHEKGAGFRYHDMLYTVELSDLNPRRIDIEKHYIALRTTNDRNVVKAQFVNVVKGQVARVWKEVPDRYYFGVYCDDERTKAQVAKAFAHLIKLHGGKGDLFETDEVSPQKRGTNATSNNESVPSSRPPASTTPRQATSPDRTTDIDDNRVGLVGEIRGLYSGAGGAVRLVGGPNETTSINRDGSFGMVVAKGRATQTWTLEFENVEVRRGKRQSFTIRISGLVENRYLDIDPSVGASVKPIATNRIWSYMSN